MSETKQIPDQIGAHQAFHVPYISKVSHLELLDALRVTYKECLEIANEISEEKAMYAYAPGKWSLKELFVHIMDTERIFAYRALCFSRNDKTPLPGFEENEYASNSGANERSFESIISEIKLLHASTISLFENFNSEMLLKEGTASGGSVSVRALGYIIAGHAKHHLEVIKAKYLNQSS